MISVEIARDLASIEALRRDWDDLERVTPEATGFQSFWWCRAWVESIGLEAAAAKPFVIVVREGRKMVWLLPLQVEKLYGVRWARGLGQPVTQYADALAAVGPRRDVWRAAAAAELSKIGDIDVISMIQVRADSVLANAPGRSLVKPVTCFAPYLELESEDALSKALTVPRSTKRRHRALACAAPITMELATGSDNPASDVRHAINLKTEWLCARRQPSSIFATPVARRFLEILASRGDIEVCHLRVGGASAAFEVGFVANRTYRSVLSAYDARYAYGSPGHFLTRLLVERCVTRGLGQLDLLAPAEPYKDAISSGSIGVLSVHEPFSMRGYVGMLASLKLRRPFYAAEDMREKLRCAMQTSMHVTSRSTKTARPFPQL